MMERLTIRNSDGSVSQPTTTTFEAAMYRIAAYEDTGLEPCDYASMRAAMGQAEEAKRQLSDVVRILGCFDIDHIKELAQADQDGRLVVPDGMQAPWIKAILDERDRQDQKWGFPQENTYGEWGCILAEEAGELCKELNELNFGRGDPGKMETEAVQVAAVALSILEHFNVARGVTMRVAASLGRELAKPKCFYNYDGGALCMGMAKSINDDEPTEKCKHCLYCESTREEAEAKAGDAAAGANAEVDHAEGH